MKYNKADDQRRVRQDSMIIDEIMGTCRLHKKTVKYLAGK